MRHLKASSRDSARRPRGKVVPIHRGLDTRERVLQVAQTLFAEHGYRGTSLRDIAGKIGIKAPSLLHHFPSKQQLYIAVLDRIFQGMELAAGRLLVGKASAQDKLRQAISDSIDFIVEHPEQMRLLWKEWSDESGMARQLVKRRIPPLNAIEVNFIFQGQRAGEFRAEIDPFNFIQSLHSLTMGYLATAAAVRRLWSINWLEKSLVERRKREVIDMVERTLFVTRGGKS
jgi:TetR/AcrR family transcriptional regulator